ncbi:MAG: DUF6285 domain-containing protein [Stellaceae bacterium]
MRDLPTGPELLALARDILLNDLLPLLPQESQLDARLVANSIAIAEREARAGDRTWQEVTQQLEALYSAIPQSDPLHCGGVGGNLENSDLLRRLAHDLRAGAFEDSPSHEGEARLVLWRLTIAKLRRANPRFLTANGLD